MGREITKYLDRAVQFISEAYGGWIVFKRGSTDPVDTTLYPWSVEVGAASVPEIYHDGYGAKMVVEFQALLRYTALGEEHLDYHHCLDMGASLMSYLLHNHMGIDTPQPVRLGEAVRDMEVVALPETSNSRGVEHASGIYFTAIRWFDDLVPTPQIEVPGYTTTSPADDPEAEIIISTEATVEPVE